MAPSIEYTIYSVALVSVLVNYAQTQTSEGYFWHVSDIHYDPTYWTDGISCHTDPGDVGSLGRFGHHYCDSPWELVEEALDEMVRRKPDPDFIVWTGDTSFHFSRAARSSDEALQVIAQVSKAIATRFPSVPVIPSLGNNDFVPKNVAGLNSHTWYSRLAEVWKGWIGDGPQIELFKKGGFFSKLISPNLRVLSVNTILYYAKNINTTDMGDPAGQFKWMEDVFQAARQHGEKVIVTGHVQPGFRTPGLKPMYQPAFLRRFLQLMTSHSDVIVGSHFGHHHADGFTLLQLDGGRTSVAAFTTLSVTPRQRDSNPSSPHNPSVRLVEYDTETGRHLNYKQFFINLTESNEQNETNWAELYDFRETYGVPDMSPASLNAILNRMMLAQILQSTNNSSLKASDSSRRHVPVADDPMVSYCKYIVGTARHRDCPIIDRAQIWCGAQSGDPETVETCVSAYIGLQDVQD